MYILKKQLGTYESKGGYTIDKGNQRLIEKDKIIGMFISIIGFLFSLDLGSHFSSVSVCLIAADVQIFL